MAASFADLGRVLGGLPIAYLCFWIGATVKPRKRKEKQREALVMPGAIRSRAAGWPAATLLQLPQARHEALFELPEIRDPLLQAVLGRMT